MERHYAFQSGYINGRWLNAGEVLITNEQGGIEDVQVMATGESVLHPQESEPAPETPETTTDNLKRRKKDGVNSPQ